MRRILELGKWKQLLIIFTPLWIIFLISFLPSSNANLEVIFSILIPAFLFFIFGWQYFLGKTYLARVKEKSRLFQINGIIPVLIWGLTLIVGITQVIIFFVGEKEPSESDASPVDGILVNIFIILLIHSIATLFINPNTLEKKHKKLYEDYKIGSIGEETTNLNQLDELYDIYIKPMSLLARTTIIVILLWFVYIIVSDVAGLFMS